MDIIEALLLAVIQGLTEFLPVSSSGHLVIFQQLLGLRTSELLFDISLHAGTLVAVCIVFFPEIRSILSAVLRLPKLLPRYSGPLQLFKENEDIRLAGLIVIGSIPTAIIGLAFHRIADRLFSSVEMVGLALLVTGTMLWLTRRVEAGERRLGRMSIPEALLIGFVQGLAILPGISRSGSTISVALYLGIGREAAGRYSFLLSIPAILGALVLGLSDAGTETSASAWMLAAGVLTAAVVGWLALKILLRMVHNGKIYRFAPYCWALGGLALVWRYA